MIASVVVANVAWRPGVLFVPDAGAVAQAVRRVTRAPNPANRVSASNVASLAMDGVPCRTPSTNFLRRMRVGDVGEHVQKRHVVVGHSITESAGRLGARRAWRSGEEAGRTVDRLQPDVGHVVGEPPS